MCPANKPRHHVCYDGILWRVRPRAGHRRWCEIRTTKVRKHLYLLLTSPSIIHLLRKYSSYRFKIISCAGKKIYIYIKFTIIICMCIGNSFGDILYIHWRILVYLKIRSYCLQVWYEIEIFWKNLPQGERNIHPLQIFEVRRQTRIYLISTEKYIFVCVLHVSVTVIVIMINLWINGNV